MVSIRHCYDGNQRADVTLVPDEVLSEQFEAHRAHLRSVAYRMLGSSIDADDAVQEAWLRLQRSGDGVENLRAWLTTMVARVCLDMLRDRSARREMPFGVRLPEPLVSPAADSGPERESVLADVVGVALMVVLDTLTPTERLAFVLHDMFAVPFDQIAPLVGRSPGAARQLASRARRRVQATAAVPDADPREQRRVVAAFQAAARDGNLDALLQVLDPDVVLRADVGSARAGALTVFRGAATVAQQALSFARRAELVRPALVNGAAGLVAASSQGPLAVLGFTVTGGKIVEIDIFADRAACAGSTCPHTDRFSIRPRA
jgi:RNA polymerase sigma factor (sigma-70 family)